MVTLIYWILTLFKVCPFDAQTAWLTMFIDGSLVAAIGLFAGEKIKNRLDEEASYSGSWSGSRNLSYLFWASPGVALFCFQRYFLHLTIPDYWCIPYLVFGAVVLLLPGGFTIMNLLFKHFGLIILPTWALVLGIVLDVIKLINVVLLIKTSRSGD